MEKKKEKKGIDAWYDKSCSNWFYFYPTVIAVVLSIICFFGVICTLQGQTKRQTNYYFRAVDCSVLETVIRDPFNITRFGFFRVENIYIIEHGLLMRHFQTCCDSLYYEYKFCDSCLVIKNKVMIVEHIKEIPNPDESCILQIDIERLSKKIIMIGYRGYDRPESFVRKILKKKGKRYKVIYFSYA